MSPIEGVQNSGSPISGTGKAVAARDATACGGRRFSTKTLRASRLGHRVAPERQWSLDLKAIQREHVRCRNTARDPDACGNGGVVATSVFPLLS